MLFLFFLAVALISAVVVFLWINAKMKNNKSFITGKIAGIASVICVISFGVSVSSLFTGNDNASTDSTVAVPKKTTKKSTSNNDQLGLSKKDVETFNQSLIDGLNEDQNYANSGDEGYKFSQYIDTLAYDSNRGLKIKVTSDFLNLSESDKNTVAGKAVGLAEAQLAIIGKNNDGTKKIHSNVYQSDTKLASAKFSNNREFNWK
ncbi:hypothetical protein [Companilactobacillus sp. HBUAS59699]|uniref:hypothetical protein n=1 Tax=Companilactobacillus sp. HBUAS59699 TaxID=3109358 RepID=UPI002FF1A0D0